MKLQPFVLVALLSSGLAFAQANMLHVDKQQEKQQARITQGVASGELTAHEAAKLEKQQSNIAHAEAKAEADGKVTRREREHLRVKQARASRNIYHQKHDKQDRR